VAASLADPAMCAVVADAAVDLRAARVTAFARPGAAFPWLPVPPTGRVPRLSGESVDLALCATPASVAVAACGTEASVSVPTVTLVSIGQPGEEDVFETLTLHASSGKQLNLRTNKFGGADFGRVEKVFYVPVAGTLCAMTSCGRWHINGVTPQHLADLEALCAVNSVAMCEGAVYLARTASTWTRALREKVCS